MSPPALIEHVHEDSITAGLATTEEIDAEPYGHRVSWIKWNSGFRGTALRISDRIIGVDGVRYDRERRKEARGLGQHAEGQHWTAIGAKDGQRVVLTVKRGQEILDIEGHVLAERTFKTDITAAARGTPSYHAISPAGPLEKETDGFDRGWELWMDKRTDFMSRVLDEGWRRGTVQNSRTMLAEHLDERKRVDFLVENYPGPFAAAMKADWDLTLVSLKGRRYEVTETDLAWRQLGEQRKGEIAAVAKEARAAYLQSVAAETIPPFPAVDPIRGDRASVAGKIVVLPPLKMQDWVMDMGKAWLTSGGGSDGWYFLDAEGAAMIRAVEARWRFQRAVTPDLAEVREVIGRIGPNPKMLVNGDVPLPGLLVEPVAIMIGGALFVDLTREEEGVSRFAGEAGLTSIGEAALDAGASPEEVMAAFVLALKTGAESVWRGLFATWDATRAGGRPWYRSASGPASSPNPLGNNWVGARRLLLKDVFDVRVVAVDEVATVLDGTEFDGAPKIEQTIVEVEHVGLFDREHRTFKNPTVTRLWTLQRRDGGPWRIVTERGI